MTRVLVSILVSIVWMSGSDCIPFCDIQTVDNVFNIGHLIYITRCGEVWTYDPRMFQYEGGFTRDYSVYTLARRHFGGELVRRIGHYDNKLLRFATFSFQEVNCLNSNDNLERVCARSVFEWNGLSVIASNETAVLFRYTSEFKFTESFFQNPLDFDKIISKLDQNRNKFWPQISVIGKDHKLTGIGFIWTALFDVDTNRLYMGDINIVLTQYSNAY